MLGLVYRIPEAELVGVSDVFVEAAEKLAADLGMPTAYRDHRPIQVAGGAPAGTVG